MRRTVGEDLEFPMSMSPKPLSRDHSILIDHPQRTVLVELFVLVVGKAIIDIDDIGERYQ